MKPALSLFIMVLLTASLQAADMKPNTPTSGDLMLADYFRNETAVLAQRCLSDIQTLDDWKSKRDEYRRQLQEMLGLWPMPERTDLQPVITGKLDHDEFTVEKLHFQASPHLYVTANLYLPKKMTKPAPAILYVCGHSRVFTNGVSYGNKVAYQHHGEWFARNGYVCLVIDTLQLGEIEGRHRGTHTEGQWWWNSRGYTPAGVEAWFGIRALDYLCSRPEVDKERIGMTGRSGGGSYSWTVAALDERVKVVCPIAGITDLENQVVDGALEGHCDCMFYLNTYRWDFPQCAALIAPRPLLIGNSDKDRLFPLDGVERLHEKVARIYKLYGATNNLGLLITEGPHADTQDLQVPVFRWFNRFLKGEQPLVEMAARKFFEPKQLKVFDTLPADAVNTNIQSLFVPQAKPLTVDEVKKQRASLIAMLKGKTFGGWPAEDPPLDAKPVLSVTRDGIKLRAWDFTSQPDVRLRLYLLEKGANNKAGLVALTVLSQADWTKWLAAFRSFAGGIHVDTADPLAGEFAGAKPIADPLELEKLKKELSANNVSLAFFAPRGVGLTAWSGDAKKQAQIRRRFMLLGQTLGGMQVWDVRRAVQMVHFVREGDTAKVELRAAAAMSSQAQLAALFEPGVRKLKVESWREPEDGGGDYLNLLKFLDARGVRELNRSRESE